MIRIYIVHPESRMLQIIDSISASDSDDVACFNEYHSNANSIGIIRIAWF